MSQFDYGVIDPNSKSGSQLALDLNSFRDALHSLHRGASRPPYVQPGMLWVQEISSARWDLVIHDGTNDLVLRSFNPTTSALVKFSISDVSGLDSALSLAVQKDAAGTTGAALIPAGTSAQRPGAPFSGMIRYNSTIGKFEGYSGSAWAPISAETTDANALWAYQPIGVPIPLFTHLTGVVEPPTNQSYRYVKLTAADAYNTGILTSESVSGSAPLVLATAVINLTGSPLNGQTVRLINTERRVIRAGSSGTVEGDAFQAFGMDTSSGGGLHHRNLSGGTSSSRRIVQLDSDLATKITINTFVETTGGAPRTANETRPKNIGATYYMRVK